MNKFNIAAARLRTLNPSAWLFRGLGKCGKCMRAAFACAALALVVAIFATAALPVAMVVVAWLATAALTMLWVAHVWKFTIRSIRATAVLSGRGPAAEQQAQLWTRRRVVKAFFGVLVFSAAITAFPRSARAQGCNCWSESDCHCPPDFPQCVYNPSRNESTCCGPNTMGCASPTLTYCCPPGSQCYGTDQCWG